MQKNNVDVTLFAGGSNENHQLNSVVATGQKDILNNPNRISAIIDGIANGLYDDIPIWENKRYKENPLLCDGDGPINKFRTWVNQFYK